MQPPTSLKQSSESSSSTGSSLLVPSNTRLLTADDVADILGVARITVMRLSRAGRLPHIKVGKVLRFRLESINQWIAAQEGRAL
jgi:excisionase family DNA binding protein